MGGAQQGRDTRMGHGQSCKVIDARDSNRTGTTDRARVRGGGGWQQERDNNEVKGMGGRANLQTEQASIGVGVKRWTWER